MESIETHLEIMSAQDGGYIVLRHYQQQQGYALAVLFAGSLADCLDYMRRKMTRAEARPDA